MIEEPLICKHCGREIMNGEPWHTVAEMHWSCYEEKFGPWARSAALLPPREDTPKFEGTRLARANGGHLIHVVDGRTGRALCGHSPINTSRSMRARGKWNLLPIDYDLAGSHMRICSTCDARRPTPAAESTLDAVIERCIKAGES